MPNFDPNTHIVAPTYSQLQKESFKSRLWMAVVNLPFSRRGFREEIVCAFRDNKKKIVYPNGWPYSIPDIDSVFGDDPDMRWLSYYKKANPTGEEPEHPSHSYHRLEVMAIYFMIRYPEVARHFDR